MQRLQFARRSPTKTGRHRPKGPSTAPSAAHGRAAQANGRATGAAMSNLDIRCMQRKAIRLPLIRHDNSKKKRARGLQCTLSVHTIKGIAGTMPPQTLPEAPAPVRCAEHEQLRLLAHAPRICRNARLFHKLKRWSPPSQPGATAPSHRPTHRAHPPRRVPAHPPTRPRRAPLRPPRRHPPPCPPPPPLPPPPSE
jgi:hypothetical protein